MVIFESKLSKVTDLSVRHKASTVPNTDGKNSKWSRGPPEPPGYCRHLNHCPRRPRSPFGTSCWRRWSCNWLPPRYPQKRLWSEINLPRGPPRPSRPRGWHTGPAYRQTDGRIPLSLSLWSEHCPGLASHLCQSDGEDRPWERLKYPALDSSVVFNSRRSMYRALRSVAVSRNLCQHTSTWRNVWIVFTRGCGPQVPWLITNRWVLPRRSFFC